MGGNRASRCQLPDRMAGTVPRISVWPQAGASEQELKIRQKRVVELPRRSGKDNLFMSTMVGVRRFLLITRMVGGILGDRKLGLPENVRY